MDDSFVQLAIQAIAAKPRQHVDLADVLATCCKESHANPIFNPSDHQLSLNLSAAKNITGLTDVEILDAATIKNGVLTQKIGKFRCEPGFWTWAQQYGAFDSKEKFLLSCSFGVGQQTMRYFVPHYPESQWISTAESFIGDVPAQLLLVADTLDGLMNGAHGDKQLAYARYNGGGGVQVGEPVYNDYGHNVKLMAANYRDHGVQPC